MSITTGMNVYQMYYANGKRFGYFICRDTWGKTIAKVISIEGVNEGENIPGRKPYHRNQIVMAEFYKETDENECHNGNIDNVSAVRCAGTYSYDMI